MNPRASTASCILDPTEQLPCSETHASRHPPKDPSPKHLFKEKEKKKKDFLMTKGAPYDKCGKLKNSRRKKITITPSPAEKLCTVFGT